MTALAPPRAVGRAVDGAPVLGERLRAGGTDRLLLVYGVLWVFFVVTAFRMPWTPIRVVDEASGFSLRQVFLTLGFVLAARRLLASGTLAAAVSMHLGGLLLAGAMVCSAAWSLDPGLTAKRSLVYVFGFLFFVSLTHASRWPLRFYMKSVFYGMGWISWLSIAAHFAFPLECTELPHRPGLAGWSDHPNVIGPCLQMAWGLGLGYPTFSARERLTRRVMMFGILTALCMTGSVTAWVATALATGVYVGLTTSSYRAGVLILLGVAAMLLVNLVGLAHLKSGFLQAVGRNETMSGRDALWGDVYREALKSPVFGAGYGSFWYEGRGLELTGSWNPRQAHNAYLDVFVDLGFVGLLVVLSVIHWRILTIWQTFAGRRGTIQRNAVAAFVSMAVGLLGVGAFGESFLLKMDKFQFCMLFWGVLVFENRDRNHVGAECSSMQALHHQPRRSPVV